jgi:hypothetical protein
MNIQAARVICEDMFRPIAANMWLNTNVQPVHPNTLERRNMQVHPLLRYAVTLQQNAHVLPGVKGEKFPECVSFSTGQCLTYLSGAPRTSDVVCLKHL